MPARVLAAVGALLFVVGSVNAFRLNAPATSDPAEEFSPPVEHLRVALAHPDFVPRFEQRVLADGRVSGHEYHQAALRAQECMARNGLVTRLVFVDSRWRFRPTDGPYTYSRYNRVGACTHAYVGHIGDWYREQLQPHNL